MRPKVGLILSVFYYNFCRKDGDRVQYLNIYCLNWKKLTTTNIDLPRRVFNTYDIEYITIEFGSNSIKRIPSPAVSAQLSGKLQTLSIKNNNIKQIDPNAFDDMPMLKELTISFCGLEDDLIRPEFVFTRLINIVVLVG
jgi:hypothetical protein